MKIAVVGTGYVGLVQGTCLAESGNDVVCVDKVQSKIDGLVQGRIPIYEPGLGELVHRNLRDGRLSFTTNLAKGIGEAEIVFIAVGTPQGDNGGADLGGVWEVGCQIAAHLRSPKVIVVKSTVPVGTNAELARRMAEVTKVSIHVASNPEFLKEGAAIDDFNKPDRVVVGVRQPEVAKLLHTLYEPFLRTDRPFLVMSPESAEMTKYVANCLLATKISFINEMANLCEGYGADINDVRRGIGHDQRIGFHFLFPGVGYGGSCFPKDIRAVVHMAQTKGLAARMMEAVDSVNEAQKNVLFRKIDRHFGSELKDKTIALWGLAFKPRTDDVREAPALVLIDLLLKNGASLRVHDPEALANVRALYGDRLVYCDRPYGALEQADALVVVTEWNEFRNPDFEVMRRLMRQPVIFDGRNVFDPVRMAALGFTYQGIGRAAPHAGMNVRSRSRVSTCVLPSTVKQVLEVPADRLAAVIGAWPQPALLESGSHFGDAGRYSILTAYPRFVWEATGASWASRTDQGTSEKGEGDILSILATLLENWSLAQPTDHADPWLPPFQGGMIGFFGYDLAPRLERLPRRHLRDSRLPDIRLALYDTAVIIDSRSDTIEIWGWDLTGEGRSAAEKRCRAWRESIERASESPRSTQIRPSTFEKLTSSFNRETYLAHVKRVLDYIAAGDVFQVNLSQRFIATGRPEPLDLYGRLKAASPAPFAAFLQWDDLAVVSASPELFYQSNGDTLVTRPIKGTRPRGRVPDDDRRLAAELRHSAKDRAELTMIVDLERNDLGRVCQYGSVVVLDPMKVESFAHVHHLVATVEGTIRPGAGPIDVVRAVFPGGSITGAPKIRAMEIIDELELNRRSLYTGAIGYFSRGGSSAFNIAIRTVLVEGDRASFQVGGGIVADSDPEAEFEETLVKGRGMRAVISRQEDHG